MAPANCSTRNSGAIPPCASCTSPISGKPAALSPCPCAKPRAESSSRLTRTPAIEPDAISKLVRHFVESASRRGRRKRESGQSHQLAHALAGARIRHQPESRKARVRFAELHSGRSRSAQRAGARKPSTIPAASARTPWRKIPTSRSPSAARAGRSTTRKKRSAGPNAPETASTLIRQRFRWTFGTLQAFWKHRDTLGRTKYGTLGWIALPNMFSVSASAAALFSGDRSCCSSARWLLYGASQFHFSRLPQLYTSRTCSARWFSSSDSC